MGLPKADHVKPERLIERAELLWRKIMKRNFQRINLIGCLFCFFLLAFFSFPSNAYPAPSSYFDTVQKIYIGYYQRPADPGGLIYWAGRLDSAGGSFAEIIETYANSAESQALYGTINSGNIADVVNGIYNALFGRGAEPGGLSYYVNGFNTGQFTAATIMLNVLYGAQNEDLQSVNNKLTAANLFTETIDPDLDGSNLQVTYAGDPDAIAGRNFLTLVTSNLVTLPTQAGTTAYIQTNIADPGDPIAGIKCDKCDFSTIPLQIEKCFGGVGPGCEGVPVLAPMKKDPDSCKVTGWISAGSILHDKCCIITSNAGYACNGFPEWRFPTPIMCKEEWDIASNDFLCENRMYQAIWGPYECGSPGDVGAFQPPFIIFPRIYLRPGIATLPEYETHSYSRLCEFGCEAINTNGDPRKRINNDICGEYCICSANITGKWSGTLLIHERTRSFTFSSACSPSITIWSATSIPAELTIDSYGAVAGVVWGHLETGSFTRTVQESGFTCNFITYPGRTYQENLDVWETFNLTNDGLNVTLIDRYSKGGGVINWSGESDEITIKIETLYPSETYEGTFTRQ